MPSPTPVVPAAPAGRRRRLAVTAALTGALLLPAGPALAADPAGAAADAPDAPAAAAAQLRSAGSGTQPVRGLDLDALTIPELQQRIDDHELSSAALTAAYLQRIASVDPLVGAVLAVNPDALDDARASDAHRRRHGARSALEGVPVLLKDNVDTADMPTTAGSRALLGATPDDAALTQELRDAGAVIIGKANLSEWANFRSTTATSGWSGVGGQTKNAYVLDRDPSGSSSGSAAGVAASLAQVAIGTETDGSIVSPSAANGVVGIKPTLGLVSRTGVVPISAEQDTAGPIARSTVDAAVVLSVISGEDAADAATTERPDGLDTDVADGLADATLAGKRVGYWTLSAAESAAVDDATEAVYAQAVQEIQAAGATAVPVQLPYQDVVSKDEGIALGPEFKRDVNAYLAATPGDHPADLAGLIAFDAQDPVELALFGQETFESSQAGPDASDPAVVAAREEARRLARASIDETLAQGPGADDDLAAIVSLTNTPSDVLRYQNTDGATPAFVYGSSTPAAVAGYPSVTVPAGFAGPQGALPVGISFTGTRWDDADVVDLAHAYEEAAQARRAPGYLPTVGQ